MNSELAVVLPRDVHREVPDVTVEPAVSKRSSGKRGREEKERNIGIKKRQRISDGKRREWRRERREGISSYGGRRMRWVHNNESREMAELSNRFVADIETKHKCE